MNVRRVEQASIRRFLEDHRNYLTGTVLDFGCGRQPYRALVEISGGRYFPYDRADFPGAAVREDFGTLQASYDVVLCTQVLQYAPSPVEFLTDLWGQLKYGGHLVMTYPTCWDEVEEGDLFRFTRAGVERLLADSDFEVVVHESRGAVVLPDGFRFPLGYGVIARAS